MSYRYIFIRNAEAGLVKIKSYNCLVTCNINIYIHICIHLNNTPQLDSWRRSIVVRTLVSAGELSLSCARLLVGCVTSLQLSHPLSVSQHGQLSHPSLRGR